MTTKPVEILKHPENPENRIFAYESTREVPEGDRPLIVYVGTDLSEDRYGSVIDPKGGNTDSYMKSGAGVFCWAHDYSVPSIGKCIDLQVKKSQMLFTIEFAVAQNPLAKMVYELVRDGFMPGSSIGFIPTKWEDYKAETVVGYFAENRKYLEWELLELSSVVVPANRNALKLALSKGVATERGLDALGLTRFMLGENPIWLMRALANTLAPEVTPPAPPPDPAARAEDEPEPATPEEALKELNDATGELMQLWNASDKGDDDAETVMSALDDAEELIDEAVAALKKDAEDDKKEKGKGKKKSFKTVCAGCKAERTVEVPADGILTIESCGTCDAEVQREFGLSAEELRALPAERLVTLVRVGAEISKKNRARIRKVLEGLLGHSDGLKGHAEELESFLADTDKAAKEAAEAEKKETPAPATRADDNAEQNDDKGCAFCSCSDCTGAGCDCCTNCEEQKPTKAKKAKGCATCAAPSCKCGVKCESAGCGCCESCTAMKKAAPVAENRGHDETDVLQSLRQLNSLLSDGGEAGATPTGSKGSSQAETPGDGSGESAPAWRSYLDVIMRTTKDE